MRRRRQKNALLPKMIGFAVVLNAILLPLISKLAIFKTSTTHYTPVELIKLPPLKKLASRPPVKKKVAKARPKPAAHRETTHVAYRPPAPNPNQAKLVVSKGGSSSDTSVENNGTGKAGQVPTAPSTTPPTPAPAPSPTVVAQQPPPTPVAPPPPTPAPEAPPAPHVPVLVPAEIVSEVKPVVPDGFDDTGNDTVFRALFTIHPDGSADVKLLDSTGSSELDSVAIAAAKQWKFKAATQDGQPVESYLRLKVEFEPA